MFIRFPAALRCPKNAGARRSSLSIPVSVGLALVLIWLLETAALSAADSSQLAEQFCASCHGVGFTGGRVPAIRGGKWRRAHNDDEALRFIADGLPEVEMPAFGRAFSPEALAALVAYIKTPPPVENLRGLSPVAEGKGIFVHTELQNFRVESVAEGYETPWSLAFLPDGRLLVSERAGRLRIVDQGKNSPPIRGIPRVWYRQDAGLLSLALDPDYPKNGWIYLSYSEPGSQFRTSMTKIVRGHITDGAWTDQQVIWQAEPRYYWRGDDHYGCRLLFVQGKLFFTIGDRGDRRTAQDISNPCGKVHRVEPDGSVPSDNPFVGKSGADPTVWSYGHRNPQGLAFDSQTGELWETEHGPMGGDELNLIRPGMNYGWPEVTFGREHNGDIISEFTTKPGMVDPIVQWTPSIAVCPVHLCISDRYPAWKHQLLVGSLERQEFRRIEIKDGRAINQELLFRHLGRIRDIQTGPDGYLYLAIEHRDRPGQIVRLIPAP